MDRLDLTGNWTGRYSYSDRALPAESFEATIVEQSGKFDGTSTEPNSFGPSGGQLDAILDGMRTGTSVEFTKTYDGANDCAHAVRYAGELASSGASLTGIWSFDGYWGAFQMTRQRGGELDIARTEFASA